MNSISRLTGRRLNIVCIVTMMVLSSILIMTPMVERASAGQDNWWNNSWDHRVLITFNTSQIQGSHTNFPVLVIINSTLASKSDNGNSSRFVAYWDNSTALNAELEGAWNNSGNNTIWLNMTHFDNSSHYKVWYYYNYSSAAANWNGAGVWNSNYVMVQHLDESPANDVAGHLDSTSNCNNGTPEDFDGSSESTTNGTGQIDGADVFDEGNDYVHLGNPASLAIDTTFTLTAWVKTATASDDEMIISRWGSVGQYSYGVCINNTNPRVLASSDGTEITNKTFTDLNFSPGEWHYVVGQWNGSHLLCYIDGVKSSQSEVYIGGIFTGVSFVRIGASWNGLLTMHFNGSIDEVRISNVARSADWISTSYNNQNDTLSFMSFGGEQDPVISVSSPVPHDEATNISIPPSYFNITISDAEGETMNITWQANESGSWSTFNVTTSVNNGTYNATNTSWVDDYNTKYWWRVLVNDSNVNWNNQTFYFTTRAQYVPDEPSSFTATTVNSDQIDLSWIKGSNAGYTRIQQKIGSYPTSISDGTNVYNNTGSSCSDASLSEGTTYYYRAWSWNNTDNIWSSGNASVSNTTNNIPTITTPRPTNQSTNTRPTPQQNITINDADGDTMILTWYSNSSGSWVAFGSNSSVGNGTYHQINSNFSGYNTKYWWNVTVTDSRDTNTSAIYHFTTRAQYTPNPPSGFNTTTYNRTQINLTWTKGDNASHTYIEWNNIESWTRGNGNFVDNSSTNTSYQHTGLNFTTLYYYQAWGWNATDNCWSTTNTSSNATTASNTLPSLSGETPANGSTDEQRWPACNVTVSDDDDPINVSFYYENATGSWVLQQTNSSVASGTSVVWSNFTNASDFSTVYNWSVNATDGYGWTNETYNFTTRSPCVPDPPTSFSASANGKTQIDLSWTKGNKANKTYIRYKQGATAPTNRTDGIELYNGTEETTSTENNLSAGTKYSFKAWSWNDTGNCWSIANVTCSATTESSGGAPPGGPGGDDTTSPTTPTNVRCTTPEADDTPSFAWDAATDSSGILGYYVKIDNGTDVDVGDVLTWTYAGTVGDGDHTFYVKAKDASSNGNIGSYGSCSFTIDTIEGADPPIAVANGPYTGLTFQIISFDGSSSHDIGGTITNYTWDFGDGTPGYGANPTHIYNLSGTYTIILTVTDNEGLTNSDTTTAIIKLDSDGDGWSDDMENSYGTNATDPTDKLKDTDGDGIPDDDSPDGNYTGDPDDDDDGLNDEIEEKLGSDPKNATDVKSLDIEDNYIIDIDGDGQHDKFYNATSKINTTIELQGDGTYLIDRNGNGKWDYTYDPKSGEILPYETQEPKREFPWLLIIIGTITAIVVIIFLLFKTGFLYVEEKKPEE